VENGENFKNAKRSNGFESVWKNYDLVFKDALTLFKGKTLEFLGLSDYPAIGDPLQTETVNVAPEVEFSDLTFALSDGRGIHFEEEVDLSGDDLLRFCGYHVELSRRYKKKFVTVIFTLNEPKTTEIADDQLRFSPIVVNGKSKDADEVIQKLRKQVAAKEPINELDLIYLPLFSSKTMDVIKRIEAGAVITNETELSPELKKRILVMMLMVSNKLVEKQTLTNFWKEFSTKMKLVAFEVAEEVGIEKGKIEGKIEYALRGLRDNISEAVIVRITELPSLYIDLLARNISDITLREAYDLYMSEFGGDEVK
jgi:hypothetical protein